MKEMAILLAISEYSSLGPKEGTIQGNFLKAVEEKDKLNRTWSFMVLVLKGIQNKEMRNFISSSQITMSRIDTYQIF